MRVYDFLDVPVTRQCVYGIECWQVDFPPVAVRNAETVTVTVGSEGGAHIVVQSAENEDDGQRE